MDSTWRHHDDGAGAAALDGDEAMLERMGHKQELKRNFSMLSMLGLAFAILNTWTALAAAINLALPSGGTPSVTWGLVAAGLCTLCQAASLAEFLSAFPTAGGQYHWVAIVAWERSSRALSYVTGWITIAGWVAVTGSGALLGTTFVANAISFLRPGYEAKSWHQFLIYVALTLFALVVNVFFTRLMPLFTKASFYWSIGGFVVVTVTVLACASPNYQIGAFVYGHFVNEVGWPDCLAWLLGLLQGAWSLTAFEATAHMIEEIPQPHIQGPRVMIYCVLIGVGTGFVFLSALLFCVKDLDRVIQAPYGPLLQIFMDATNSVAGSTCLLMIPTIGIVFTMTALVCASSRMSYAFARDGGLPFSRVLAQVHDGLDVPLNALLWTTAWVIVFGCIYLGSTSTFSAITAAAVVSLSISYALPVAINVLRGRKMLLEGRYFRLSESLGWTVNMVSIMWTVLTTVLFGFPPKVPVTASNMNYCIVAFGIILLIAVLTWVLDGKRHYKGPKVDVQGLLEGRVEGIDVDGVSSGTGPTSDVVSRGAANGKTKPPKRAARQSKGT